MSNKIIGIDLGTTNSVVAVTESILSTTDTVVAKTEMVVARSWNDSVVATA